MDKVHTILPRFDGELLPGSFAVVAHTVTSYRKTNQGVVVGETANLNVQWVLLLGSPDQPRPARVALSDNDGKSVHGQGSDDNGEGGGGGQPRNKRKALAVAEGYTASSHLLGHV